MLLRTDGHKRKYSEVAGASKRLPPTPFEARLVDIGSDAQRLACSRVCNMVSSSAGGGIFTDLGLPVPPCLLYLHRPRSTVAVVGSLIVGY